MEVIYRAEDGTLFDDEYDCQEYEFGLMTKTMDWCDQSKAVFAVSDTGERYSLPDIFKDPGIYEQVDSFILLDDSPEVLDILNKTCNRIDDVGYVRPFEPDNPPKKGMPYRFNDITYYWINYEEECADLKCRYYFKKEGK